MKKIDEYFQGLTNNGLLTENDLSGCSRDEIDAIMKAQRVAGIPSYYRDFLAVAGRSQGGLMRGSDWSYDDVLKLASDARDLLEENGVRQDFLEGSLVFLMHQGYTFYFFPAVSLHEDDPPVWVFEEGESGPQLSTDSFTDFLAYAAEALRRHRERWRNPTWVEIPYPEDQSQST